MLTDSDFAHWRKFATLKIWEIAAMLYGVDPRELTDITDKHGDPLDLSHETRILISAVHAGQLESRSPGSAEATNNTELLVSDLIDWLRVREHGALANGLESEGARAKAGTRWTPAFTDAVRAYRALHTAGETATKYGVSTSRIRNRLKKVPPAQPPFRGFPQTKP